MRQTRSRSSKRGYTVDPWLCRCHGECGDTEPRHHGRDEAHAINIYLSLFTSQISLCDTSCNHVASFWHNTIAKLIFRVGRLGIQQHIHNRDTFKAKEVMQIQGNKKDHHPKVLSIKAYDRECLHVRHWTHMLI